MEKDAEVLNPLILLVDDEREVRKVISASLQLAGYTVLEAANGSEAIRLHATRNDTALLITDICMPKMDGLELAERLTATDPHLKVIYMTGYCEAAANALPGSVWIRKPFAMQDFLSRVCELLSAPKVRRAAGCHTEAP